jgi:hypothetical protein
MKLMCISLYDVNSSNVRLDGKTTRLCGQIETMVEPSGIEPLTS